MNFFGPLTLQPTPSFIKALLLFPLIPHYCVSLKPAIPYLFPLGTSQFLPPLTSVKPKFDLSLLVLTPWMISCNPAVSTMPFIQVSSMSPLQPRPRPEPKGLPPNCLGQPLKGWLSRTKLLISSSSYSSSWRLEAPASRQSRTFHSLTLHIYPQAVLPSLFPSSQLLLN